MGGDQDRVMLWVLTSCARRLKGTSSGFTFTVTFSDSFPKPCGANYYRLGLVMHLFSVALFVCNAIFCALAYLKECVCVIYGSQETYASGSCRHCHSVLCKLFQIRQLG